MSLGSSTTTTRTNLPKRVCFDENVTVWDRAFPSLSRKELRTVYYQRHEISTMTTTAHKQARDAFGNHQHSSLQQRNFKDDEDDFRGLETMTGLGFRVRETNRKRALLAVFREQKAQQSNNNNNAKQKEEAEQEQKEADIDERIAKAYAARCERCRESALERGRRYIMKRESTARLGRRLSLRGFRSRSSSSNDSQSSRRRPLTRMRSVGKIGSMLEGVVRPRRRQSGDA